MTHLARLDVQEAVPRLVTRLAADEALLAQLARQALLRLPSRQRTIAQLLAARDLPPSAEAAVLEILAELGARAVLPRARAALAAPHPEVRLAAANALLVLRAAADLPQVLALAPTLEGEAQALLTEWSARPPPPGLADYLAARLADGRDPEQQYYAVQMLLHEMPADAGAPPAALLAAAATANPFVRGAALLALARFPDAASRRSLEEALTSEHAYVRGNAAVALWQAQGPAALPMLTRLVLEDPAEEVVMAVLTSLYRDRDGRGHAALRELAPRLRGEAGAFVARALADAAPARLVAPPPPC